MFRYISLIVILTVLGGALMLPCAGEENGAPGAKASLEKARSEVAAAYETLGRAEKDSTIEYSEFWNWFAEKRVRLETAEEWELWRRWKPIDDEPLRMAAMKYMLDNPLEMPSWGSGFAKGLDDALLCDLVDVTGANAFGFDTKAIYLTGVPRVVAIVAATEYLRRLNAFSPAERAPEYYKAFRKMCERLPGQVLSALAGLMAGLAKSEELRMEAFKDLSGENLDRIREAAVAVEEEDGEERAEPDDDPHGLKAWRRSVDEELYGHVRMARVDFQKLFEAARALTGCVERAWRILTDYVAKAPEKELAQLGCEVDIGTAIGRIKVTFDDADTHDTPYLCLIDLAGNDKYVDGALAAERRTSLIIDVAGDDSYESTLPFSIAAPLCGTALLIDCSGDDYYSGDQFSIGSCYAGTGILYDIAGDDYYSCDRYGEGCGKYGIGVLCDLAGHDSYRAAQFAQGCGLSYGAGVLLDVGGDDEYYAGGKYPDPRGGFSGMSQGCGFGLYLRNIYTGADGKQKQEHRAHIDGGIGILIDKAGEDSYDGGGFSQGVGYFLACGMLIDEAGDDVYKGTWYAQGASAHFALSALLDYAGDDRYEGTNQVQGNGRDFSCSIFYDLAGNDRYISAGRSQGSGDLFNGTGIFIDVSGDDFYRTSGISRGKSVAPKWEYYEGCPAPVGVFLDLGGADKYEGVKWGADMETWGQIKEKIGIGIDKE